MRSFRFILVPSLSLRPIVTCALSFSLQSSLSFAISITELCACALVHCLIEIGQCHMFGDSFTLCERKNDNKQFRSAQNVLSHHMCYLRCAVVRGSRMCGMWVCVCVCEHELYVPQSVLVHIALLASSCMCVYFNACLN